MHSTVLFVDEDPLALLGVGAAVRRRLTRDLTLQHVCGLAAGVACGRRERFDAVLLQPAGGALEPLSASVALLRRAAAAPVFLVVREGEGEAQRRAARRARAAGVLERERLSLRSLSDVARIGAVAREFGQRPPRPANTNTPDTARAPTRPRIALTERDGGGRGAEAPPLWDVDVLQGRPVTRSERRPEWIASLAGLGAPAYHAWSDFACDLAPAPGRPRAPANDRPRAPDAPRA